MKQKEKEIRNEIALGIVKNKEGKIIIINRLWKEKSADGLAMLTYAFPGGNIDPGETPQESVAREVRSETGLKVKVLRKISERIHPQFAASIKYYECEMIPSASRPIFDVHEVESVKWVSPNEIRNYFTTDLDPKVAKFLGI